MVGKLTSIQVTYEMSRQPMGQYTSDKMGITATIIFEADEKPDMMNEIKAISGSLKLACHKRIQTAIKEVPTEANQK